MEWHILLFMFIEWITNIFLKSDSWWNLRLKVIKSSVLNILWLLNLCESFVLSSSCLVACCTFIREEWSISEFPSFFLSFSFEQLFFKFSRLLSVTLNSSSLDSLASSIYVISFFWYITFSTSNIIRYKFISRDKFVLVTTREYSWFNQYSSPLGTVLAFIFLTKRRTWWLAGEEIFFGEVRLLD